MKLSKLQGRRFFNLFDLLMLYANERLDVVEPDELIVATPRGFDDRAQAEIAYELWKNRNVIDDFVRENPAGLSAGELGIVAKWRDGLSGHFVVMRFPDDEVRFMCDETGFEVCGLSREIPAMIDELPAFVETTLLPFDDVIVYSEYLNLMPIRYSDAVLKLFDESAEDALRDGRIVKSANGLIAAAERIREKELQRDLDDMLDELNDIERGAGEGHPKGFGGFEGTTDRAVVANSPDAAISADGPDAADANRYGQHRGILAGLSEEERKRVVREHFEADRTFKIAPAEQLKQSCEKGDLHRTLHDLLELDTKEKLQDIASLFGIRGISKLRKGELVDVLVERIPTKENLQIMLSALGEGALCGLRALTNGIGVMHVQEDDIVSLARLPRPITGLCYVFYDGYGLFSFVMPDEMLPLAREVDWDDLISRKQRYYKLVNVAEAVVQLRGLAPVDDVAGECRRLYPGMYEQSVDFVDDLLESVASGFASYSIVDDGDEMYLLSYSLEWQREYDLGEDTENGSEDDDWDAPVIDRGPLGETAEYLLKAQGGKEPRPLELEMLKDGDLYHWKEKQPAVITLRNYLDANVPDVRDDCYFSDKVIEELLGEMMWGAQRDSVQRYLDILKDNDFLPREQQAQHVLDLLSNMANSLPVWPNNGWAPFELLEAEVGHRIFRDENGRPLKIGRNDPCPCGSGKKYKKCCGR